MNKRRVKALIMCVLLLVLAGLGIWTLVERAPPSGAAAARLLAATYRFSGHAVRTGQGPPTSVQLSELVSGGYITVREGRRFRGADISLIGEDGSTHPDAVLIRLQLRDGRSFVLMGDGSIHER